MKKLWSMLVAVSLGGGVAMAGEGIQLVGGEAVFTLNIPDVRPPLIVIQPGVSVIRDYDVEVFYANGYYWSRRDQTWFRSHDHRGTWARVDDRHVPAAIAKSPPGHYRNYKGDKHQDKDKDKGKSNGHGGGHGDGHS
jgi:hypothetical protein